ncbi:adhesion G-protein coupled receptor G2-like [Clavelina lepadiformis]|uniref:adhesion G-protein coupled receptor G2-like n=1 Tax=Clavelina lepadiformis TaxID=159417 RepID=UPI004041579B
MSFGKQSLDVFTDKLLQGYCKNWNAHYQEWVLEGCCLNQNSDYPECLCGRVGDFVLFVESEEVRAVFAISIIVYIGTTLKFIGYFITFIILISFRVLRQQTQYKVLANIFFCLFTTYLIFILGIDQRLKPIVCGFIAGLLHYFLLACFSWFAVMAKLLYGAFVTVLGSHIHCFLPKACLFAYVLPLIPAAITAGITLGVGESISSTLCVHDPGNAESVVSRYVDDRECLIKGYSLYFGLLLPIAVILLYNWICFVIILQKIVCRKNKVQSSTPPRTMKQHLLMVSTLSISLGLDSTVTYLMVIAENEIYSTTMRVVFVILSTIQGVAVVYFVCINNAEVKNAWWSSVKKKFNYFSNVCCLKQIKKSKTQDDQVTADRPIELLTFQT